MPLRMQLKMLLLAEASILEGWEVESERWIAKNALVAIPLRSNGGNVDFPPLILTTALGAPSRNASGISIL